jgi:hypothetical protein
MVKTEIEKLTEKFTELESRINEMGKVKPVKEKKPRKPSEYNIFMGKFMADDKKKNPDKPHTQRFTDATKAWSEKNPKS